MMKKEEVQIQKRLIELSRIAYQRNITTYSDFLNLNELNILHTTPKTLLHCSYETFGGHNYAERQMISFQPDALYFAVDYPIAMIGIKPRQAKFAESLTHRDFLGAILNLGVNRSKIGDILVMEDQSVVFVQEKLGVFILDSLTRVKHTEIAATLIQRQDFHYTPVFKEFKGTVASVRLDSILTLVFPLSRNKVTGVIEGGRVYVNGRLITTNSYQVKEEDVISVRGMGKLIYKGILSQTKKKRLYISVYQYM